MEGRRGNLTGEEGACENGEGMSNKLVIGWIGVGCKTIIIIQGCL
jgi:hypothetical protein